MRRFDPDRYYMTTDPELVLLGTPDRACQEAQPG